jgi:hypothetical protein
MYEPIETDRVAQRLSLAICVERDMSCSRLFLPASLLALQLESSPTISRDAAE